MSSIDRSLPRRFLAAAVLLVSACACAGLPEKKPLRVSGDVSKALNEITAGDLRADLSFLASDAMAGRDTPSRELDIAAEFIASRFRQAGLEAPLEGGYLQKADLTEWVREMAKRHKQPPPDNPVIGQNVTGILRGSDRQLRDTYVIVSAHYDHIGTSATVGARTPAGQREKASHDPDHIYNGADDDGSGTVSVIALAQAFARMKQRPRRSIIFLAFCGEELGLLGSRYYADHPVVPLAQTVAQINLEQLGRSDGDLKRGTLSMTGLDFTSLTALFVRAGQASGVRVVPYKDANKYFAASDNLSFARLGIPDTTLCAAFEFPDYHGLKDEWPKIDYDNMAVIDRAVGTVLWTVADAKTAPVWNAALKETKPYREAAAKNYGTNRAEALAASVGGGSE